MSVNVEILLADDHPVVRAGYRFLLEKAGYSVSEVESAETAYQFYKENRADVVIMDISMPGMGGLEGLRRLLSYDADAKVLILSMYEDNSYILRTQELGAKGYLTKNSAATELLIAVEKLLLGKKYIFNGAELADDLQNKTRSSKLSTHQLSPRQFEIFCFLAEGRSVVDIATDLSLSPKTVNNHRSDIMTTLKLKNSVELSRFAIRHGIIQA